MGCKTCPRVYERKGGSLGIDSSVWRLFVVCGADDFVDLSLLSLDLRLATQVFNGGEQGREERSGSQCWVMSPLKIGEGENDERWKWEIVRCRGG